MSQCWATHAATGIRCDRKPGHDGKNHRFQWADVESTGYTSATGLSTPLVADTAAPPAPVIPLRGGGAVPDATGIDNPTGIPAVTEEDVALAERPVRRIITPCIVCQHDHAPGTACNGKTAEGMDCGCLNAIPSKS